MKANRTTRLTNDDRAQVGIGTMIVFIATILVAATAAAVLIDTSGKLQERSSATGNQATEQVASNLIVKGVYGFRYSEGDGSVLNQLTTLNVTLALAPGATTVDLAQAKVVISDGTTRKELDWIEQQKNGDTFAISEIRDPKATMTAASPVMTAGGLANLQVNLTDLSMPLSPRSAVTFMIIPEVGSPVHADFTTPQSYGSNRAVVLR